MLDRFIVKGFKSLVNVSVHLGIVNVFVGANGSGKSNLLEAVGILGAAASGRVNEESLRYRGVRPGLPSLYKSSFLKDNLNDAIQFEAGNADSSYSVSLQNSIDKPQSEWIFQEEHLLSSAKSVVERNATTNGSLNAHAGLAALESVRIPDTDPAGQILSLLRNYAIYAPDTPTLRGIAPDSQPRDPLGLAGGRLPEALQMLTSDPSCSMLEWMLPLSEWIGGMSVSSPRLSPIPSGIPEQHVGLNFLDRYMASERNLLSSYDASEGVLYLLFGLTLAVHPTTPKLFAIDNFDQALNPRTAREFTRLFCRLLTEREDRQVLLTTHNPLVLDGLPLQDNRIRLFAVDRSKRGYTVINRVEVVDSHLLSAEKGIPLSQQWVMGHFGGVPPGV